MRYKLSSATKYKIFTILFLVFSLIGTTYLSMLNQDIRDKAVGNGECACKDKTTGKTSAGSCNTDGSCSCPSGTNEGSNKCSSGGGGGDVPMPGDKCQAGQTSCQQNSSGKNTGYNCTCITALDPNDWQCTTQDLKTCPTEGGVDPNAGYCDPVNKVKIVGRCLKADAGSKISVAYKYKCKDQFADMSGGCQQNETVVRNTSSVCFDDNFCGTQQIDLQNAGSCFISVADKIGCNTVQPTTKPTLIPTVTPKPTITPKPTATIKPTNTPVPTRTPTPTVTTKPTNTPTGTPAPTNTPTNTPKIIPTNTPKPIVEGPSPTRIVLPQSGVEFPAQMLSVVGVIITLFGFLILL